MDEPKLSVVDNEEEPLVNTRMTITLEIERIFDPKRSKNNLMMTMGAAEFTDPATEKKAGEVLHGIPAHTVLRDAETKEDWLLNYGDLFTAYKKAREEFEQEDPATRFLKMVEKMVEQLGEDECAKSFDVSRSTIIRWMDGSTTPHKKIIQQLFERAEDVILKVDEWDKDNDKVGC